VEAIFCLPLIEREIAPRTGCGRIEMAVKIAHFPYVPPIPISMAFGLFGRSAHSVAPRAQENPRSPHIARAMPALVAAWREAPCACFALERPPVVRQETASRDLLEGGRAPGHPRKKGLFGLLCFRDRPPAVWWPGAPFVQYAHCGNLLEERPRLSFLSPFFVFRQNPKPADRPTNSGYLPFETTLPISPFQLGLAAPPY